MAMVIVVIGFTFVSRREDGKSLMAMPIVITAVICLTLTAGESPDI